MKVVPRRDGQGIPGELTIKLSRDAWHWQTVAQDPDCRLPPGAGPLVCSFDPVPANMNGDLLLAVWVLDRGVDDFRDVATDLVFPGLRFDGATGIDALNGSEQKLKATAVDGEMALRGMLLEDYPVVLRLSGATRVN